MLIAPTRTHIHVPDNPTESKLCVMNHLFETLQYPFSCEFAAARDTLILCNEENGSRPRVVSVCVLLLVDRMRSITVRACGWRFGRSETRSEASARRADAALSALRTRHTRRRYVHSPPARCLFVGSQLSRLFVRAQSRALPGEIIVKRPEQVSVPQNVCVFCHEC